MLHCLYELAKQTPGPQRFDQAGSAASKQKLSAPSPWVQSPCSWLCIRPPISTSKWHDTFLCVYHLTVPLLGNPWSCPRHSCRHSRPHKWLICTGMVPDRGGRRLTVESLWIHKKLAFDFLLKATNTYTARYMSKTGRKLGFLTWKEGNSSPYFVMNLLEGDPEGIQMFWRLLLAS